MAPVIAWFDAADLLPRNLIGGKVASLTEMTRAGLNVPPGFAVTAAAQHAGMGESVADEIRAAYRTLSRRLGIADPPVAVRSSAQAEDGQDVSFAGQYDTYLWVSGADSVIAHVEKVWASAGAAHTRQYRQDRALSRGLPPMCVGVQHMVDARTAGVMFTLNPVDGDRSLVVIEASWGLGEAVVRGDVNPDRFSVSKVTGSIVAEEIGDKAHEYTRDAGSGGVSPVPVAQARRRQACLSRADIDSLAELGKKVEKLRGAPQDIEWAIDGSGTLCLLQVRPETVWSGRPSAGGQARRARGAVDAVISQFTAFGASR